MHFELFSSCNNIREEGKTITRSASIEVAMAGRERWRKRRAEFQCGQEEETHYTTIPIPIHHKQTSTHNQEDYPFSPSFSPSFSHCRTPATTTLHLQNGDDGSDDASVEIISEIQNSVEVDQSSFINHAFEYVNGLRVKTEFAPVLREILDKYGDITRGNDVKSPHLLSIFLERICRVYQRVEQSELVEFTRAELQGIISQLRLIERHNIRVTWILEILENILSQTQTQTQCGKKHEAKPKSIEIDDENDNEIKQELVCDVIKVRAGVSVSVRRSSNRKRKEPAWHKDFTDSKVIDFLGLEH